MEPNLQDAMGNTQFSHATFVAKRGHYTNALALFKANFGWYVVRETGPQSWGQAAFVASATASQVQIQISELAEETDHRNTASHVALTAENPQLAAIKLVEWAKECGARATFESVGEDKYMFKCSMFLDEIELVPA